jgi:hypothetical protein
MRPANWRVGRYVLGLLFLSSIASAQHHRDPLNQLEIDQLREARLEPDKRLKLFVTFARERLASMEKDRSDPKVKDRAGATHEWLDDFSQLYDELNDNIDMYVDSKEDLRKTLPAIIEADTEFQSKLLALKQAADVPAKEAAQYEFVLTTSLEALNSGIASHRELLEKQKVEFKNKKKTKNNNTPTG